MIEINYIAILVSTVIAVVLGMGWFGPVFGATWATIIGVKKPSDMTPEENKDFQKKMVPVYITNMILTLMMMLVLYVGIYFISVFSPIETAFVLWLGFVVPLMGTQALWSGKSKNHAWTMFLLTTGYQLICFVVAGAMYGGL